MTDEEKKKKIQELKSELESIKQEIKDKLKDLTSFKLTKEEVEKLFKDEDKQNKFIETQKSIVDTFNSKISEGTQNQNQTQNSSKDYQEFKKEMMLESQKYEKNIKKIDKILNENKISFHKDNFITFNKYLKIKKNNEF